MQEMALLAQAFGAQQETVHGLAGLGDLILTCTGKLSKNVAFGRLIGLGTADVTALVHKENAPEGVNTVQSLDELARERSLILPIANTIFSIIFEKQSVSALVACILRS